MSKKLAAGVHAPAASSVSETPLKKRYVVAGRRGMEVELPWFGRVWIELPGAREWQEIEATVRRVMLRDVGELSVATAGQWESEKAIRVCAAAVRDVNDHDLHFGTLEEWEALDNDIIGPAWIAFGDVRDELDPMSTGLSPEDAIAISVAIKKKDAALLRTFAPAKLRAYMITSESPPSTSSTPSSPNSESPSEPSA